MRVAVLGSRGLVGDAIARRMDNVVLLLSREVCDVNDSARLITLFRNEKVDTVINCAARVGGIQLNKNEPYTMYDTNTRIGNSVLAACLKSGVTDLVQFCSNCAYPARAIQPYKEIDLLMGEPVKTNKGYAAAKVACLHAGQAAEEQFGLRVYHPIPCSLFGLRDNYDVSNSHFVAAVIRRINNAVKQCHETITFWGTGTPRRELLYADELSSAISIMIERRYSYHPLNIGTGIDTPIRDIIEVIADHAGYRGRVLWDETKPDGAYQKLLDSSLINSWGWHPSESMDDALCKTYDFFSSSADMRL